MSTDAFRHEAVFYAHGDEGFLGATLALVDEAVSEDAAVLVAVGPDRASAMREALGDRAEQVHFAEMHRLGRNPARIIPVWEQFVHDHADRPMLGIGEPVWPGRSRAELDECDRHETLLNLAFDDGPAWRLLCPYDLDGLDDEVIETAHRSHPILAREGRCWSSEGYSDSYEPSLPLSGGLPPRPTDVEDVPFTGAELARLRRALGAWTARQSLPAEAREELVLAVNELTTNSVLYGGGRGTLSLWSDDDGVVCEVRDRGHIREPLVGRVSPTPHAHHGRGVWIANQLCDLVQIRSGPGGTVVRVQKRR